MKIANKGDSFKQSLQDAFYRGVPTFGAQSDDGVPQASMLRRLTLTSLQNAPWPEACLPT